MTLHLYYDDSYLKEFSAVVLDQGSRGEKPVAILDRTAFYPTSGGQPHDTGVLGAARVVEVEEEPSGVILHILDSVLPPGPVQGRIDWERRFDHMQQHTGQHILSQAFLKVAQAPTISFHLGRESCTIDIDLSGPSPALMEETEDLASRTVFENRRVRLLMADRSELGVLGVRKDSQREGLIRVIDIEDFDRSPCGGTHVRRSGEVGMISVLGYERYKGGTRVEFVCGGRALRTLRRDHGVLKSIGKLVSAHPNELPRLVEKLCDERTALERENARLQDQILEMEASDLLRRADQKSGKAIVRARFTGRTLESLKLLAQKIAAQRGAVAILGTVNETAQLVVAKSADVSGNCGAAIKEAAEQLGGKGGGKPELAQAGGIQPAVLEAWFEALAGHFLRMLAGNDQTRDETPPRIERS